MKVNPGGGVEWDVMRSYGMEWDAKEGNLRCLMS